ncbi:DUF6705 family protein [Flavobacterium tegetincola]|uniref:DUF6705 family protein n=1 Tax=Flavobacterium tegetincola TaxID=150172 RepID=UPI00042A06BC|nr:DUF6705 family protein [Flavobacterium tegetincola]
MKYILIISMVLLRALNAQSQENIVLPLNHDPTLKIQNGTYIKDIDNIYLPYLGNWETQWEGKKMTITIQKNTKQLLTFPNGDYYYEDYLIIKFRVIDLATQLEFANTYAISNLKDAKIRSISTGKYNQLSFLYMDPDLCNNSGKIKLIRNLGNPNELFYQYRFDEFWMPDNCPYLTQAEIPIYIPTVNVTLTKQ